MCYNGPSPDIDETQGWTVKTSPIPNKPGPFAEVKSVNYLQNALNLMDAQVCAHFEPDSTRVVCRFWVGPLFGLVLMFGCLFEFRLCTQCCSQLRLCTTTMALCFTP